MDEFENFGSYFLFQNLEMGRTQTSFGSISDFFFFQESLRSELGYAGNY